MRPAPKIDPELLRRNELLGQLAPHEMDEFLDLARKVAAEVR